MYNEADIISQLKEPNKQEEAFGWVVRSYSERLYWQIRKMVLSHDDANDILQNTFLKAWQGLDQFRGEAKLSTWLYKISVNECITFLNKQRAQSKVSIDDVDSFLLNKLESSEYIDGDETQIKLQKAILNLPDRQRLVFNMKYFEDMKYEEMSEVLGVSVGALKASYHHAVKKIEDFFSKDN